VPGHSCGQAFLPWPRQSGRSGHLSLQPPKYHCILWAGSCGAVLPPAQALPSWKPYVQSQFLAWLAWQAWKLTVTPSSAASATSLPSLQQLLEQALGCVCCQLTRDCHAPGAWPGALSPGSGGNLIPGSTDFVLSFLLQN
jgi:hypothetical protein